MSERDGSYFGSVRFFKNMILLIIIAAISVPAFIAVRQNRQLTYLREELAAQAEAETPPPVIEPPDGEESGLMNEAPAYQELFPDFYAPGPLTANEYSDRTIYLTFDDGPSQYTGDILAVLEEQGVKATFFVAGPDSDESRSRMRDIVNAGHTLAMHTYSHDYDRLYASVEGYLEDMYRIFSTIRDATGVTPTVFRFPGGSINGYNFGIYQELISEMLRRGFVPYDWNISAEDTASGGDISVQRLISDVTASAAQVNRGFILMHDSSSAPATPEALSPMIGQLREMGFAFAPITERVKPLLFKYS